MKTFYLISIIGMLLLGIIHTILGFNLYPNFDLDFFWFTGTGLALISSAIANYMNYRINTTFTLSSVSILNVLILSFSSVIAIIFFHIPGTLVAIFSLSLLITSISHKKKSRTQWQTLRRKY